MPIPKAPSKFVTKQKGRFMPPGSFKTGKGIPQPTGTAPMMKRGGKVAMKKKRK